MHILLSGSTAARTGAPLLDDPDAHSWTFKTAETHRRHVERAIERNRCDIDCLTVRSGSPHGLQCAKTQASHERRMRQRAQDLQYAQRLGWAGQAG